MGPLGFNWVGCITPHLWDFLNAEKDWTRPLMLEPVAGDWARPIDKRVMTAMKMANRPTLERTRRRGIGVSIVSNIQYQELL